MPAAALLGLVMCRLVPLLCGDNQVVMGEGTQSLFRRRPGANRKAPEDGERRSTVNTAIHMSTGRPLSIHRPPSRARKKRLQWHRQRRSLCQPRSRRIATARTLEAQVAKDY
jgi:hypothetical protein